MGGRGRKREGKGGRGKGREGKGKGQVLPPNLRRLATPLVEV